MLDDIKTRNFISAILPSKLLKIPNVVGLNSTVSLAFNTTPVVDFSFGTLMLKANDFFAYLHDSSKNFADSLTYEVSEGAGTTDQAPYPHSTEKRNTIRNILH